jgi:hypothetical protein
MKVGGNAKNDVLVMTILNAVEKWLILGGVPGDVEHYGSLIGDQVHAVSGIGFAPCKAIGGIDITVADEVGDGEGWVPGSRGGRGGGCGLGLTRGGGCGLGEGVGGEGGEGGEGGD